MREIMEKLRTDSGSSDEADALHRIASALKSLGKEDAIGMGAIEGLALAIRDAAKDIAYSINELADAIREHKS